MTSGPNSEPQSSSQATLSSETSIRPKTNSAVAEDSETVTSEHPQKRPRLDSGSRSVRSLSVDQILPSNTLRGESVAAMDSDSTVQNSPAKEPSSRITIHVRPNIQSPEALETSGPQSESKSSQQSHHDSTVSKPPKKVANGSAHIATSPASSNTNPSEGDGAKTPPSDSASTHNTRSLEIGSGPDVPIEIDDLEDIETTESIEAITIDGDDDLIPRFIYSFPYRGVNTKPLKAAQQVVRHLINDTDIDRELVSQLYRWMKQLDDSFSSQPQRRYWNELFYDNKLLWDQVAFIMHNLITRDYLFSPNYDDDSVRRDGVALLHSYINLVNRLIYLDFFNLNRPNHVDVRPLLSLQHLAATGALMWSSAFVQKVLIGTYGLAESVQLQLAASFVLNPLSGLKGLAKFFNLVVEKFQDGPDYVDAALHCVTIANGAMMSCDVEAVSDRLTQLRPSHAEIMMQMFNELDPKIREGLNKDKDHINVEARKMFPRMLGELLRRAMLMDEIVSANLFRDIVGVYDEINSSHYPSVATCIWRIKLLKQYICTGRMELRVLGVDQMCSDLISFYNEFPTNDGREIRSLSIPPEFECVAQVLVNEKIVDYIVGPSSHPQLISRSGNTIGFIVIANKFTTEKADLVWKTLVESEDPRTMQALLQALTHVVKSLTTLAEDMYLCTKIIEQPLPSLEKNAQIFVEILMDKLRRRLAQFSSDTDYATILTNVCIRLMCQCSQNVPGTYYTKYIRDEAVQTLVKLAEYLPSELRKSIYGQWVFKLENNDEFSATYMQAIFGLLFQNHEDLEYLAQNLKLTQICTESFIAFVETVKSSSPSSRVDRTREREELVNRLQLILFCMESYPQSASSDTCTQFWEHLVGQEALSTDGREIAWRELTKATAVQSHGALKSLRELCLPRLEPENFTPSLITFLERLTRVTIQEAEPLQSGAKDVLQLPGVDLMWRVMLSAPDNTGETKAMKFLAGLWIDNILEKLTGESLEDNHKAIVQLCIQRMTDANDYIRSNVLGSDTTMTDGDEMDIRDAEKVHFEERAFCRCVAFLRTLMNAIRQRPDLIRHLPVPPSPELKESSRIHGRPLTIKFQVHSKDGKLQGKIQERILGDLETRKELYERIRRWCGFPKFKVIWGGKIWDLLDNPKQSLRDVNTENLNLMMIREEAIEPIDEQPPSPRVKMVDSVFDGEIISNFDNFYQFMDSKNRISSAVNDFLKSYPPNESICLQLIDAQIDPETLFPSGRIYKMYYAVKCLRKLVDDEIKRSNPDQELLLHFVRLMEWLFINRPLPEDQNLLPQYLTTFQATVGILFVVLNGLGDFETSPFQDGEAVVERLIQVIAIFLKSPPRAQIAHESYELLLHVTVSCPKAWTRFQADDVRALHTDLLLVSPNPSLRGNIMSIIKTFIGRFKNNTHIDSDELVEYYWELVANLIDQSPKYWVLAAELFGLSDYLFRLRFYSATDAEKKKHVGTLQTYWNAWSKILIAYKREEVVGREILDAVIVGLSTLLMLTFDLLRDQGQAPESERLAENLWSTRLFPDTPFEDSKGTDFVVPLLDSRTRSAVYRLLTEIMVNNGTRTFAKAAAWIEGVSADPSEEPLRTLVDRSRLIRPEAGYLGLRNLGNTCYMNSLLTQLYMNPAFRSFLINQHIRNDQHQLLLQETQMLFSRMQNGYGPYGDPYHFARNIRTYFDEIINTTEQMDVEEFFNLLFDQWENQLDNARAKEEFRSFYGGKLVNQIKSKECDHVSENEERYLNLQCDVQGKSSLAESLQALVEGDVMQGDNKYKCEKCGGKFVNAVRRARLKEIPDDLILHLKRFEYDIGLQRRSKINDYFEFPASIDMSPYQVDHLNENAEEAEPDMFELVGVLVHRGTAEHGHYFSYIRARPSFEGAQPQWLLFDDADVSIFDVNDLADACFGGSTPKDNTYNPLQPYKINNAYMLFYQRSSSLKATKTPNGMTSNDNAARSPIPVELKQQINCENALALRNYCLFGEPHAQFVKSFAIKLQSSDHESAAHTDEKKAVNACLKHIWRVSSRAKDLPDFSEMLLILLDIIKDCSFCGLLTFSWIAKHVLEFRDLVCRSNQARVRQQTQNFVVNALKCLRDTEMYGIDVDQLNDVPRMDEISGALVMFVEPAYQIMQQELHFNAKGFDEFLHMIWRIACLGEHETMMMICRGFFTVCVQFLTLHRNSYLQKKHTRLMFLFEKRQVAFNSLALLFGHFLQRMNIMEVEPIAEERPFTFEKESGKFKIIQEELQALELWDGGFVWFTRILEKWEANHKENKFGPLEDIVSYFTAEDHTGSLYEEPLEQTLLECCENMVAPESELYIRATRGYLTYTKNLDAARAFIKVVNKLLDENEGPRADCLFDFYDNLRKIVNQNHELPAPDLGTFYKDLIASSHIWAPVLLSHSEGSMVRYQTISLLEDIFFQYPPVADPEVGPTDLEVFRAERVRNLFKNLAERNRELLEQDYGRSYLQPLMASMKGCAAFIQKLYQIEAAEALRNQGTDQQIMDAYSVAESAFEAAPMVQEDDMVQDLAISDDYSDASEDDLATT